MISQKPKGWQGDGFPALRLKISPLSLGSRENALTAELQTMHSTGAHSHPYWQLQISSENTGDFCKKRVQEGQQFMHPVHPSLAGSADSHHRTSTASGDSPTLQQPCSWALPLSSQCQPGNSKQPRLLCYCWTIRPAAQCV